MSAKPTITPLYRRVLVRARNSANGEPLRKANKLRLERRYRSTLNSRKKSEGQALHFAGSPDRIKPFRRPAARYENHAANVLTMLKPAATQLALRPKESAS